MIVSRMYPKSKCSYRCLRELEVPHFHHELVYEAVVVTIEDMHDATIEALVRLLKACDGSGIITPQQMQRVRQSGTFQRMILAIAIVETESSKNTLHSSSGFRPRLQWDEWYRYRCPSGVQCAWEDYYEVFERGRFPAGQGKFAHKCSMLESVVGRRSAQRDWSLPGCRDDAFEGAQAFRLGGWRRSLQRLLRRKLSVPTTRENRCEASRCATCSIRLPIAIFSLLYFPTIQLNSFPRCCDPEKKDSFTVICQLDYLGNAGVTVSKTVPTSEKCRSDFSTCVSLVPGVLGRNEIDPRQSYCTLIKTSKMNESATVAFAGVNGVMIGNEWSEGMTAYPVEIQRQCRRWYSASLALRLS